MGIATSWTMIETKNHSLVRMLFLLNMDADSALGALRIARIVNGWPYGVAFAEITNSESDDVCDTGQRTNETFAN